MTTANVERGRGTGRGSAHGMSAMAKAAWAGVVLAWLMLAADGYAVPILCGGERHPINFIANVERGRESEGRPMA